jgi:hypothetical protein
LPSSEQPHHATDLTSSCVDQAAATALLTFQQLTICDQFAASTLGALFHNGKEARPIQTTLEEMGHPQPPAVIKTGNNTAASIASDSIKQKRSKAVDMRFHWIHNRV